MVPRHDPTPDHDGGRLRAAGRALCLANRDRRDGEARLADGADAARPDRHDDDRSGADRPARRCRRGLGRARAPDPVPRIRVRHGPRLGGGDARSAGLWRARAADGAPLAAHGPVGGGDPRRPDQRHPVVGRGDPARGRADARGGGARRPLSGRSCLVDDPGLVLHRVAQLHERGQPPRAGALDHAGGDPAQRAARLRADPRVLRAAAPRPARRRARHHIRQSLHVRRGGVGVLRAATRSRNTACSAASGGWTGS